MSLPCTRQCAAQCGSCRIRLLKSVSLHSHAPVPKRCGERHTEKPVAGAALSGRMMTTASAGSFSLE
eukprot:scaffold104667_cov72-Phaeocystis_antarctica.AAC.9